MNVPRILIILIMLIGISMSGCGFKLRGFYQINPSLKEIDYQSNGVSAITRESIKQALQANQVVITDSTIDAQYTLRVFDEETDRQTLTVGNNAKAAEYELQQQFVFEIRNREDVVVYGPSIVKGQRIIQNDPDNYSGQKEEERQQSLRLRRDLVNQLMRRLQSISDADLSASNSVRTP